MFTCGPSISLSALAQRYGSDKTADDQRGHGYTRVYEALLASRRGRPLRILEIGLLHPASQSAIADKAFKQCPSLDMWADYIPSACVYGLDLENFSGYRRAGVVVVQCDQGDRCGLLGAVRRLGAPFDLIIEDGSHASQHQQISLGALFPFVRPGGWYIIEDLQWQPMELEREGLVKTRDLLREIALGRDFPARQTAMHAAEIEYVRSHAGEMMFFDSLRRLTDCEALDSRDALCVIPKVAGSEPEIVEARALEVGRTSVFLQEVSRRAHSWTAGRDLWIWGAGSGGRRILAQLRRRRIDVAGVIDSDARRSDTMVDEYRVDSPEVLAEARAAHPFVLVASDFAPAISEQLQRLGMDEGLDFVATHYGAVADLEAESRRQLPFS